MTKAAGGAVYRVVNAMATSWSSGAVGAARPSFAAVAEAELDAVHRYLLFLTRDRETAEDLTGETFEKAFRRWRRFDPRRASARTWLCQIARTVALDHLRSEERRRRREARYAHLTRPNDLAELAEPTLSPWLDSALSALTAAEREVIALRVILDLDAESTARLLGISTTACTTRFARALAKLEEMMEGEVRV